MKLEELKKQKKILIFNWNWAYRNATNQEIKDWYEYNTNHWITNFYDLWSTLIINQSESDSLRLVAMYSDRMKFQTLTKYEKIIKYLIIWTFWIVVISMFTIFWFKSKISQLDKNQTNLQTSVDVLISQQEQKIKK